MQSESMTTKAVNILEEKLTLKEKELSKAEEFNAKVQNIS